MKRFLSILMLLLGQHLIAQTIVTEAPSMTNSTYTLGTADFQIESRLEYAKNGINNTFYLPVNLFRVGLGKRFEFRTQNGVIYRSYNGFDGNSISFRNISLGGKYGIIGGPEKKTTLAIIADMNLPEYKSNVFGASFILAASHTIKEKHAISYNLNYSFSSLKWENYIHNYRLTLMYSTMLSERVGVYGEVYADLIDSEFDFNDDELYSIDFGFIYLLRDHIQLDYSFGTGLNSNSIYHALGFNILFPKK